ncbi:Flp family type IVb pilin [Altererythrobacter litoralis]|uniref:Flp family type IVb pilin n=1 Tax=Altererythrobacter litoralis TaxID=3113904 RepID=A0ABU7GAX0_9SPHN|nr:Flp family type IVb pilin [Erythrobacteraceae bacterium 1XM1-14]
MLRAILSDEQGATAIEYGLIVALIAIGLITALQSVGTEVGGTFNTVSDTVADANAA